MNALTITFAAGVLALLAQAAPGAAATMLSPQDSAFVVKAARGGAAEVADAKIALQTTRNQRVDAFANRMVTDHSKANIQLAAIMRRQGIPAPAGLGSQNQAMYNRLETVTGRAFDSVYIAGQKTAHQETIALFKKEIRSGKDAQLVAFAKSTLPIIESHLNILNSRKFT
jgi:putative membrane protein